MYGDHVDTCTLGLLTIPLCPALLPRLTDSILRAAGGASKNQEFPWCSAAGPRIENATALPRIQQMAAFLWFHEVSKWRSLTLQKNGIDVLMSRNKKVQYPMIYLESSQNCNTVNRQCIYSAYICVDFSLPLNAAWRGSTVAGGSPEVITPVAKHG